MIITENSHWYDCNGDMLKNTFLTKQNVYSDYNECKADLNITF